MCKEEYKGCAGGDERWAIKVKSLLPFFLRINELAFFNQISRALVKRESSPDYCKNEDTGIWL